MTKTLDAATLKVTAPFDGALLGEVALDGWEALDAQLGEAHRLARDRSQRLLASRRVEILRRAAELLEQRSDQFSMAAAREGGKPLLDSKVELDRAVDGLRNCAECLRSEPGHVVPMGATRATDGRYAFTSREPIGVVLAISAFNHPVNLIVHQVGPAIAAGCPVLVKPAKDVPLSCIALVELLREAGLPEAWCRVVMPDSHDTLERLAKDARVAFLSFIGSPRVGWHLRSILAPGTRCALEHGGVAPVIVTEHADLTLAASAIAKGGFYHAGQVCVSVQRVFAHASVCHDLLERLVQHCASLVTGDPTLASTQVGPLIRAAEVDRIDNAVKSAVAEGAELVCGGEPLPGQCYAPTVLLNPAASSDVSRAEIFGPVVCVYGYDTWADAIERANSTRFSFQAAVFSERVDDALSAFEQLDCSALMVNDHTAFRADWMPFAGLAQSGLGVGGIPHTYADMAPEKMMVLRTGG